LFLAVAAVTGQLFRIGEFSARSASFLAAAGVVHFVIGRYCGYRSIQAMGANLASPVQQWSLLVTLSLAVVYLHETLDALKVLGIALMVLGPTVIVGAGRARRQGPKPELAARKFKPRLAEGYFFGILCCLCWGSSPILVRAGLEGTGLALAGGVISYSSACIAVLIILLFPVARHDASGIKRSNMVWFYWIGITVCVSQMFMYMAMAIAPVTIVQPLMRFSNIFGVLFSWILNRDHEVFDPSVLAAIAASVVGAMALSIDPGWLADFLGAPDSVRGVLAWSWPR
jgi:drug/metabolite transporter (DMT)-like permease